MVLDDGFFAEFERRIQERYNNRNDEVMLFSETLFLRIKDAYHRGDLKKKDLYFLHHIHNSMRNEECRYQDIRDRLDYSHEFYENFREDNDTDHHVWQTLIGMGQGIGNANMWRGRAMYKTPADQSILGMLLYEYQPKTIIEFGTCNGSSTAFMADTMNAYNYPCDIITFDYKNEGRTIGNIQYINADCNDLDSLEVVNYDVLPHPWVIVEDAHANTPTLWNYLASKMIPGDTMIIEDTDYNQEKLLALPPTLKVDTKYTDYFGFNMCCSPNSILHMVKHET